jgi:hypothetical protein
MCDCPGVIVGSKVCEISQQSLRCREMKPSPGSLKTTVYNIKDSGSNGCHGPSQSNEPRLTRGRFPVILCLNFCFIIGISMVAAYYLAGISLQTTCKMVLNNTVSEEHLNLWHYVDRVMLPGQPANVSSPSDVEALFL